VRRALASAKSTCTSSSDMCIKEEVRKDLNMQALRAAGSIYTAVYACCVFIR
jgi:hypothetical protein